MKKRRIASLGNIYVTNFYDYVIRIMDGSGKSVASYSYNPWGKVLSVSEDLAVAGQPLRYASYVYDTETQLYYLKRGTLIRRQRGLFLETKMVGTKITRLVRIYMLMRMMIR